MAILWGLRFPTSSFPSQKWSLGRESRLDTVVPSPITKPVSPSPGSLTTPAAGASEAVRARWSADGPAHPQTLSHQVRARPENLCF